MNPPWGEIGVRPMRGDDLAAAAVLAGELGYPVNRAELAERFSSLEHSPSHALLVAAGPAGSALAGGPQIAGWIHVEASHALIHDPMAEIVSLVVASGSRGRGIGAALVRASEAWARSRGLRRLRVRCRLEREDAHRFYEREGFEIEKTQHVFSRSLTGGEPGETAKRLNR